MFLTFPPPCIRYLNHFCSWKKKSRLNLSNAFFDTIANNKYAMVNWVKFKRFKVLWCEAITCINDTACVLMDILIISRNTGDNRLSLKDGHNLGFLSLDRWHATNVGFGSLGF